MIYKAITEKIRNFISENGHKLTVKGDKEGYTHYMYLPFWVRTVENEFPDICGLLKHDELPDKVKQMAIDEGVIIPDTVTRKLIYWYKDKPYTVRGESKIKLNGEWHDTIEYRAEYQVNDTDDRNFVRLKKEFLELFKPIKPKQDDTSRSNM